MMALRPLLLSSTYWLSLLAIVPLLAIVVIVRVISSHLSAVVPLLAIEPLS
jgi:hypothetical protein